jgi:hypothetical protein
MGGGCRLCAGIVESMVSVTGAGCWAILETGDGTGTGILRPEIANVGLGRVRTERVRTGRPGVVRVGTASITSSFWTTRRGSDTTNDIDNGTGIHPKDPEFHLSGRPGL